MEAGTYVTQDGYGDTVFEVVGEWRGYPVLADDKGCTHKAPAGEVHACPALVGRELDSATAVGPGTTYLYNTYTEAAQALELAVQDVEAHIVYRGVRVGLVYAMADYCSPTVSAELIRRNT